MPGILAGGGGEAGAFAWLGVLVGGFAGYLIGVERFPGTGAEYALAGVGGLLGTFVGLALAGVAFGALVAWGAGRLLGVHFDLPFCWPIYIGAGLGGLFGFLSAVAAWVETIRWWRYHRVRRPRAGS
jgi:hypothetical protein